jgi:hypothetical protein
MLSGRPRGLLPNDLAPGLLLLLGWLQRFRLLFMPLPLELRPLLLLTLLVLHLRLPELFFRLQLLWLLFSLPCLSVLPPLLLLSLVQLCLMHCLRGISVCSSILTSPANNYTVGSRAGSRVLNLTLGRCAQATSIHQRLHTPQRQAKRRCYFGSAFLNPFDRLQYFFNRRAYCGALALFRDKLEMGRLFGQEVQTTLL